ncbi:MAG: DUF4194 domain-containing protein [Bacteroidia bacterium]|jgi:hypothetical protein|nr:DUF4194 domain-containing protein [Bacteroidia bacterium]
MTKEYSPVLIALLKGIVYSSNEYIWEKLINHEHDVKDYFNDLHLDLYFDKSEGYAYLKQRESEDGTEDIPKLIDKRPLNFHVSLLCLLLRQYLIESDNQGESTRAILSGDAIINMMKPFLKDTTDEVKQNNQIVTAIKKVIEEGFLRRLNQEENLFEINRIIKAFVNADIVQESLEKLQSTKNS